jgi:NAD dependent epimerase/dehydratase
MDWNGKKVLVTGAGGFIGSHLVEKLTELGAKTYAFVRYNSRNDRGLLELLPEDIQDHIEVILGDLRDPESVKSAVKNSQIIFHLGASIAIPYSYVNPRDAVETNVIGTLNILNSAREYEIERVIQTSSSEVYGTARYSPIDENHPLQAQSPYAASKIAADKLAESYFLSYDLPVSILRPFNTYGPRQSARAVIPTIIIQALKFDSINLGSLHPTRDFNYVDDTVNGFIKIAESSLTIGEVINVGTGKEISIGDIVEKILSLTGKKLEIISDDKRIRPPASEIGRLIADYSKAKKLMNWEPKVPLDEGLKRTIDWFSNFLDRYKADIYNV